MSSGFPTQLFQELLLLAIREQEKSPAECSEKHVGVGVA